MIKEFKTAVCTIKFENYDSVSILALSGLNIQTGEINEKNSSEKLQHKFMQSYHEAERNIFITHLSNQADANENVARYVSTCGRESGAVILANPKTPQLTFSQPEFRIMLRRRCGLSLSQISVGLRCNCSKHPVIDQRGKHCVTQCKKGQGRLLIHDGIKQQIAAMCRYAQLSVRQEPADLFRSIDAENNKKPDLEIRGLLERGIFGDVAITEPCNASVTANNARIPLRAAKAKEAQKKNKYRALTLETGNIFVPMICETQGAWGKELVEFFDIVIAHASEARGIRKDILANYWRRRIAVALHKAIAQSILAKVGRSRAGPFRDESNYELVPYEQSYVGT
jgi:hypothetical protein